MGEGDDAGYAGRASLARHHQFCLVKGVLSFEARLVRARASFISLMVTIASFKQLWLTYESSKRSSINESFLACSHVGSNVLMC